MEFIVAGAPRSANANPRSRRRWRERVSRAARESLDPEWQTIESEVSVLIIYFYYGRTSLDVDNIGKSMLDALKGVIFRDDRQVSELILRKTPVEAGMVFSGASPLLLGAVEHRAQRPSDFVYVRVDPTSDHSRIP
jgi:hypothetical protein